MKSNDMSVYVDSDYDVLGLKETLVPVDPSMVFYENVSNVPNEEIKNYVKVAIHWRPLEKVFSSTETESSNEKNNLNVNSNTSSLSIGNKKVLSKELKLESEINPTDINYGIKANFNLISVLSHLAEYPQLVSRLLTEFSTINPLGFYSVRIFQNGVLTEIPLDGLIPCFPKSFPIYINSNSGKSVWAILIEKAMSKIFKSYNKIRTKPVSLFYKMLTGFSATTLKHTNTEGNVEKISEDIETYMNSKCLVSCFSDSTVNTNTLNFEEIELIKKIFKPNFHYPLLVYFKQGRHKLYVIRNVFTDHNTNLFSTNLEYYSMYSAYSKDPNRVSLAKVFEQNNEKSTVILSEKEFFSFFNCFSVVPVKPCIETTVRSRFTRVCDQKNPEIEAFISAHYFEIEVNDLQQIEILLNLKDEEFFSSRYRNKIQGFDLSVAVLVPDRHDTYEIQYAHFFEFNSKVSCEISLTPGRYIIIPRTTGVSLRKHQDASKHVFQAFSNKFSLNMDVLEFIFEDIFLLADTFCKNYLNMDQTNLIINRLSHSSMIDKLESEDDFNKLVNKYCKGSPGLSLKGFKNFLVDVLQAENEGIVLKNFLVDVLQAENEGIVQEILNNFGYDRNMYPFLNKFFYMQVRSSKPFGLKVKPNLQVNFDQIANDVMLKHKAASEKSRYNSDCSPVSIRQNLIYLEGIKNNNKKEDKMVTP